MKNMRKLFAMVLAIVMVLSLATTAFAAGETYTLTLNNAIEGHTYTAYQVFTGDLSDGVLSNIVWGDGVSEEGQTALGDAAAKAATLTTVEAAEAFAAEVAPYLTTVAGTATVAEGATSCAISNLEPGYYLVRNDSVPTENGAYTSYIMKVVEDTTANVKADLPEIEKKIVEGNNEVEVNEASIGENVYYKITGDLPSNLADYNTYYYVFNDTLSKGLTYVDNSMKVYVDGVDVTEYFYINIGTYDETNGTKIVVGIDDILTLNLQNIEKEDGSKLVVTKDSKIVVTYTAVLNEKAVIAGEGNPNDVKLDYSNNPNQSGEGATEPPETPEEPNPETPIGQTPEQEVVTFTTELTITKKDGTTGDILPGVEFTLTTENGATVVLVSTETYVVDNENGTWYKLTDGTYTETPPTDETKDSYADENKYSLTTVVVAKGEGKEETTIVGIVNSDGTLTFTGLGVGTYTLTETGTPEGYNTIEPITFEITFDANTKTFKSSNKNIVVGADNKLDTTINNYQGSTLPETGGMGTTLFYMLGGIMVLAAVVLLVTKKRMASAE